MRSTAASRATTRTRSRERITAAVEECDALLTSGAVSMGDFDYVKIVLEELAATRPGSQFVWSQVAIKPAKPLAFGTLGAVPVFGLPGNPVSSRVSFELFARPALRRLAGRSDLEQPIVRATARTAFARRPDGKLHLDRVRARRRGRALRLRAGRVPGEQRALGHGRGDRAGPDPRRSGSRRRWRGRGACSRSVRTFAQKMLARCSLSVVQRARYAERSPGGRAGAANEGCATRGSQGRVAGRVLRHPERH